MLKIKLSCSVCSELIKWAMTRIFYVLQQNLLLQCYLGYLYDKVLIIFFIFIIQNRSLHCIGTLGYVWKVFDLIFVPFDQCDVHFSLFRYFVRYNARITLI